MINLLTKNSTFIQRRAALNELIGISNNSPIQLSQTSAPGISNDVSNGSPKSTIWVHEINATSTDIYVSVVDTEDQAVWLLFASTDKQKLRDEWDVFSKAEINTTLAGITTTLNDGLTERYTITEIDNLLAPIQQNAQIAFDSVDDIQINQLALQLAFKNYRENTLPGLNTSIADIEADILAFKAAEEKERLTWSSERLTYQEDLVNPAEPINFEGIVGMAFDDGNVHHFGNGEVVIPANTNVNVTFEGKWTEALSGGEQITVTIETIDVETNAELGIGVSITDEAVLDEKTYTINNVLSSTLLTDMTVRFQIVVDWGTTPPTSGRLFISKIEAEYGS